MKWRTFHYAIKRRKWMSLSHVWFFATPWTVAWRAPLSMGSLQAWRLEWVVIPFSRESSQPRVRTQVSCITCRFFTVWATREAHQKESGVQTHQIDILKSLLSWTLIVFLIKDLCHHKNVFLKTQTPSSSKTEDQRASWYTQYWKILSSMCRFCIKTDAAGKATSQCIRDLMKLDTSGWVEVLQMSLLSWRIICLPMEVGPNHSRGRYVERISLKEGELIHPVTFLPSRKAGNLRTYV